MEVRFVCAVAALSAAAFSPAGCSQLRPDARNSPEYLDAKNEIESYEDAEGNFIRPEGARARKNRDGLLSDTKIPFINGKPVDRDKARTLYAEADTLFQQASAAQGDERKKLFNKASKQYVESAKYWRSSALEQDAWMMAAESKFFAEEYPDAEHYYVKLLRDYPRTRYIDAVDKRRMEIALYWLRYDQHQPRPFYVMNFTDDRRPWNDTAGHGKRVLEKMRLDSPTGRLADDATMELANAAFAAERFQDAADLYSDLRTTYPDSKHQFDAHFLGLKATLETYKGAQYDDGAIEIADKLLRQMVRKFPEQSRGEKEYIDRIYGELRYKKAEKLMVAADFRINRGEIRSANLYLDEILTEYSDTPFGDRARQAREKYADSPPVPTQHLEWLADLVPTNDPVAKIRQQVEPIDPTTAAGPPPDVQVADGPGGDAGLVR